MATNSHDATDRAVTTHGAEWGSRAVVHALVETKPWVTFFAAIGLLMGAANVAMGLFVLSAGMPFPSRFSYLWVLYFVSAAVCVPPSIYLLRYRAAISRFAAGTEAALITALQSQKSFWKYAGVASLMSFGMVAVCLALMIVGS